MKVIAGQFEYSGDLRDTQFESVALNAEVKSLFISIATSSCGGTKLSD
jgi:hypothetical protein